MKLIIGLGNPGEKYKNTRHNIGELIISAWAEKNLSDGFKSNKKLQSLICKSLFNGQKIILALPQTFMNNSGIAVSQISKFYKIKPQDIWVIHDDLDLPLGKVRISKNKNAAGHNGVQSIIDFLKTKDFIRFRIGIDNGQQKKSENFVLKKFTAKEKEILKEIIKKTSLAIETTLREGLNKVMNKFN